MNISLGLTKAISQLYEGLLFEAFAKRLLKLAFWALVFKP